MQFTPEHLALADTVRSCAEVGDATLALMLAEPTRAVALLSSEKKSTAPARNS